MPGRKYRAPGVKAIKIVSFLQKNQLLDDIHYKGVGVHFLFNYNHLPCSIVLKFRLFFHSIVIIFSQIKTWGVWHVGGRDFISVGAASDRAGLTWGLLTERNGKAD
jgi:hypothetical protein